MCYTDRESWFILLRNLVKWHLKIVVQRLLWTRIRFTVYWLTRASFVFIWAGVCSRGKAAERGWCYVSRASGYGWRGPELSCRERTATGAAFAQIFLRCQETESFCRYEFQRGHSLLDAVTDAIPERSRVCFTLWESFTLHKNTSGRDLQDPKDKLLNTAKTSRAERADGHWMSFFVTQVLRFGQQTNSCRLAWGPLCNFE